MVGRDRQKRDDRELKKVYVMCVSIVNTRKLFLIQR